MKLFKNGVDISFEIFDKIESYKKSLSNKELLILDSRDHSDHIAAYAAWQHVPGKIVVISPLLPAADQAHVIDYVKINFVDTNDAVFFHTSGTTGSPKVIQHGRAQFKIFESMSNNTFGFKPDDKFLGVFPPFTSAFWHILIPSFYQVGFELHLSSRETIVNDISNVKFDLTAMSSNVVDYLRVQPTPNDFSSFRIVLVGGAPVLERHGKFLFANGAKTCIASYGTTETGSPLLARKFYKEDRHYNRLDLNATDKSIELKLVDNELWVRSLGNCVNYKSFSHDADWRRTGDMWHAYEDNTIEFIGRVDDIIKINGYTANLLEIETWWESHGMLGECLAKFRSIGGNDYIELVHTQDCTKEIKKQLQKMGYEIFPHCNVPAKFTKVESLPKNSLGKKQRHLVK